MKKQDIADIFAWLARAGLDNMSELALLTGFAERCNAIGLRLTRAVTLMDTLHPTWEGRAYHWRSDGSVTDAVVEYGSSDSGNTGDTWRRSILFRMLEDGSDEFHTRLDEQSVAQFALLPELLAKGHTGHLALIQRFAREGTLGGMDAFYSTWTTDAPGGFSAEALEAMRQLVPALGLATKAAALTWIVGTVAEVYLGRDASKRVLAGQITRGVSERIGAVLWFSDLRGFTTITDTTAPEQIIPLLNDYAEAVIAAVHEQGGDVLKLIGDGILAVFGAASLDQAASAALRAEAALRGSLVEVDARRSDAGLPVTAVNLGLHVGEVFYGNIGCDERLDFTVVGPAVNEASRIVALCRSADRNVLMSSEFVAATPDAERGRIVSVGRYALRGVRKAQELFTLEAQDGL
jgi:adenylate cyclase